MEPLNWSAPRGHGEVLAGLWRAAGADRLPHALLLRGPEGIGKYHAARWLGLGLLCANGPGVPCLSCGPCRRGMAGSHPDMFLVDYVEARQNELTIHFVTRRDPRPRDAYDGPTIEEFLTLRADEGGWRVICVRDVEAMNDNAQNAFLKTLEEPGPDTLIVLTSAHPDALRDTIRSRGITVDLAPLSNQDTVAVLEGCASQAPGLESAADLASLARWSRGAPGRALTLARGGGAAMRSLLLDLFAGSAQPAQTLPSFWEIEGEFPGKTAAAQRRTRVSALIDVALELLLDHRRAQAGVALEDLAHGDVLSSLGGVSSHAAQWSMDQCLRARQDVGLNLSPEVLAERVLRAAAGQGASPATMELSRP